MSLETFGMVPVPQQLKDFDAELSKKLFKDLMHSVDCGCPNCKQRADSTASVIAFGRGEQAKEFIKDVAKREVTVVNFKKNMDKELRYL